jgi:hypothetical protein
MTFYIYKSYEPQMFTPNGLVIEPFEYPKSCLKFLDNEKRPLINVFDRELSEKEVKDNNYQKSLIINECKNLDDLKKTLKEVAIWKIIALF